MSYRRVMVAGLALLLTAAVWLAVRQRDESIRHSASAVEERRGETGSRAQSARSKGKGLAAEEEEAAEARTDDRRGFFTDRTSRDGFRAVLAGKVSIDGGGAIADVRLALYSSRLSLGEREYAGLVAETRSKADGSFRLPLTESFKGYLVVDEPGYELMEEALEISETGDLARHYRLREAADRIWGVVSSAESGEPVKDIAVILSSGIEYEGLPPGMVSYRRTRTDAQGRYSFPRVRKGDLLFVESGGEDYLTASAQVRLSKEERERRVDLAVKASVVVQVRITSEEGKAIAGARVASQRLHLLPVKSDEAGWARVRTEAEADTQFTVSASGYLSQHVVIAAGAERVEIRLKAGLILRGHVVDQSGEPVAGAGVETWAQDGGLSGGATTGPEGLFETALTAVPVREVIVRHPDYLSAKWVSSGETPEEVAIVLERGNGSISGRAISLDGAPVRLFWAQATRHASAEHLAGTKGTGLVSDPAGRFSLSGLPPGTYDLEVGSKRQDRRQTELGTIRGLEVSEGQTLDGLIVQLRKINSNSRD